MLRSKPVLDLVEQSYKNAAQREDKIMIRKERQGDADAILLEFQNV